MAHPLYLIEADLGRIGRVFIETDRDSNSRARAIYLIRSGEVKPIKVLEVCEDEGTVRDVTDELVSEAQQERDPATWEEIGNKLAALQAESDHRRDLRKHEVVS